MEYKNLEGFRKIRAISDYQFGPKITDILLNNNNEIRIERSKNTNRIRYIYYKEELLLTLRPTNGLLTLTLKAGKKIISKTNPPTLRVVVMSDISEFIEEGRNVFCKHVVDIDENLRPFDEVIVVNEEDRLLAIGKLSLPVDYVKNFTRGVGVNVRRGSDKLKN